MGGKQDKQQLRKGCLFVDAPALLQPVSKETYGDGASSREQDREVVRQLWGWALQLSSSWNSPTIRLLVK